MRVLKYKKTDRSRNKGQKRHEQNSDDYPAVSALRRFC